MRLPVPESLTGIYNEQEYKKHCSYILKCQKFGRITGAIDTGLLLLILGSGVIGFLLEWFIGWTGDQLWGALSFIAFSYIITDLYSLPFEYYSTFVIETKFGFNKTTKATFFTDTIKSLFVSLILVSIIYSLLYKFYELFGDNFWIVLFCAIAGIIVVINMFYSQIIVPLFNKQTPLKNGVLRDAIEKFAQKTRFKIKNIYVINGSKRSTKANAYFTGMGKTKRIILYDTLIEQLTTDEIVAVLAHEIGHYKHHDIYKGLISSLISLGIYLYVFSFLAGNAELAKALGGTEPSLLLSIIAFGLLLTPISIILSPLMNYFSQQHEFNADKFATYFGYGDQLINALKKLTANNLSPLQNHPLYAAFYYSHPTLLQRINHIQSNIKQS